MNINILIPRIIQTIGINRECFLDNINFKNNNIFIIIIHSFQFPKCFILLNYLSRRYVKFLGLLVNYNYFNPNKP